MLHTTGAESDDSSVTKLWSFYWIGLAGVGFVVLVVSLLLVMFVIREKRKFKQQLDTKSSSSSDDII